MNNFKTLVSGILLLAAFSSAHLYAQEETVETSTHEGSWFMGGGYLGLDSEVTDPQGVGSGGFVLDMGYMGLVNNHFNYSVGLYIPFLSDDAKFSQDVEDQYGRNSTEDSSVDAWGLLAEAGYTHQVNESTSLSLSAGFRTLSADREIAYCTDCYSEGLNLAGGGYLRPAIKFHNDGFDVEIAAMTFLSGDMTNGFMLNFIF